MMCFWKRSRQRSDLAMYVHMNTRDLARAPRAQLGGALQVALLVLTVRARPYFASAELFFLFVLPRSACVLCALSCSAFRRASSCNRSRSRRFCSCSASSIGRGVSTSGKGCPWCAQSVETPRATLAARCAAAAEDTSPSAPRASRTGTVASADGASAPTCKSKTPCKTLESRGRPRGALRHV